MAANGNITRDFEKRILREGIVDTKKYRYTTRIDQYGDFQLLHIVRISLHLLDTTLANDKSWWHIVKIVR